VADEIAERAVTLVQDRKSLLPLQLSPEKRIAVIVPEPQDLTPADTSSYIKPDLAHAIRAFHPQVDDFTVSFAPDQEERSLLLSKLQPYDLIIAGTINACASPNQAALVHELIKTEIPMIVIGMRLPYDLKVFPEVGTYLCTYSILEPSLRAAAKALFGKIEITGKLPVKIKSIGDG
jgi:beta-N-acetylhexosaminidase